METKLLTEAEAQGAWNATFHLHAKSFAEYCAELRERGLIAPEPPVDPLLIEAREICAANTLIGDCFLDGGLDNQPVMAVALAALRRGMEMRAPLTREMVWEALQSDGWMASQDSARTLHAALLKQMEQS